MKRLEIYGYGKWVDTTFDLAEDVHLFYGLNEAGKSTLMSFIHSVLFGFPTRNSTHLRYEPRESSRYGGKITATDPRFGEVLIERIHGKVTGNVTVTLEDGTTGSDEMLDTILHGMTRESFQNIFSFSLSDIEHVHKLNKNQLSRYLLNIGAHGTEYYLELVDQFQADADKIYRPSGRVLELNKQLTTLEKQEKKLADLEKKNESYLSLIEQLNAENETIETIEKRHKKVANQLAHLIEFKKQLHVFEEIQTLESEIAEVDLPPLKEDGRFLLDEYKREKADQNEKLQAVQIQTNESRQQLEQAELIEGYEENKEAINQLENQLPEMVEQLRDLENISEKRSSISRELLALEEALAINNQPMYPEPFEESEQRTAQQSAERMRQQQTDKQEIAQELQTTEHTLSLKNQKLDQVEAMMWDNQEFKEAEENLQAEPTGTKNNGPTLLLGGLAVVLFAAAFFLSSPMNWVAGTVGLLALIIAILSATKKAPEEANPFFQREYEKQVALKEEWRDLLSEVDALQEQKQQLLTKSDQINQAETLLKNEWHQLLKRHHVPTHFEMENAESLFNQITQLHALVKEDEALTAHQTELKKHLEKETHIISEVLHLEETATMPEKIAVFRRYLNEVKTEIAREQDKLNQLNALKQEEKQLKNQLENTTTKINTLIETAGVKEEAEFTQFYLAKEKVDAKKNRLRFLKENAPDYDTKKVLPSRENLERKEASFHKELEGLEKEKDQALREMTNTKLSIEHLEKDGTYTEALQLFENEKATAQRLVDEWVSDKLAAGMIKETLNQVTKDRFEEIMGDAEGYFHLLTDGEYERIVFKEEELFVQMRTGQVMDVRVLSRGTAEPLYVAIRLAYIKNTQDMMELPVIMDDPFVNFDEHRRLNMYRLLQELSTDLQIIYFTFDDTTSTYFTENQITDLEMRKNNG